MDIETAFTQDAIVAAGVDVGGDEEEQLMSVLGEIFTRAQTSEDEVDPREIAILAFVAGRAYQADHGSKILVPMSPDLVPEFMEFLIHRNGMRE